MAIVRMLLFLAIVYSAGIHVIVSVTDPNDAAVLQSLKGAWQNTPPSWDKSNDPCGLRWDGVTCNAAVLQSLKGAWQNTPPSWDKSNDPCGLRWDGVTCNAAVLQSLKGAWQNTPPSWDKSNDPCGLRWDGVTCNGSRVSALELSSTGLKGELTGDIGGLTELRSLDLSFNPGLTGSLSPRLGNLKKLNVLVLAGCSFNGNIPDELGNLAELTYLALNSNNLTGVIPPHLGKLSNLYWLDLAKNQLSGPIPISTTTSPGLDLLLKAKHFHLNENKLSGSIPPQLFSSEMILIDLLLDGNMFSGFIPMTLGLVHTLEVLWLNGNFLTGIVPSNLKNLTNVYELNLASNSLTGPSPDLSGMNLLNYVDLSNNSFDASEAPLWFTTIPTLTTLIIEYGSLQGTLPEKLFGLPELQQVKLKNNSFNDTLNMGDNISKQLQLVDLQYNQISKVTLGYEYKNELILFGNSVCSGSGAPNLTFCQPPHQATKS